MTRPLLVLTALLAAAVPAAAAARAFPAPAGWDHQGTDAAPTAASNDVWKKDGETLAVLHDASQTLDDVVAAIKKNAAAGNVTLVSEADRDCAGQKAHVVDLAFGASPKTLIRQVILPEAPGNARITYARSEKQPPLPEVEAALTAFCTP